MERPFQANPKLIEAEPSQPTLRPSFSKEKALISSYSLSEMSILNRFRDPPAKSFCSVPDAALRLKAASITKVSQHRSSRNES
jgi:hypothetical protein